MTLNNLSRRRIQQIQMIKGPNRILLTLEDLTFINPQLSRRVSKFLPQNLLPHFILCLLIPNLFLTENHPWWSYRFKKLHWGKKHRWPFPLRQQYGNGYTWNLKCGRIWGDFMYHVMLLVEHTVQFYSSVVINHVHPCRVTGFG